MRVPVKPLPNTPSPENPKKGVAEREERERQGFDAVLDNLEFFLTRLRGLSGFSLAFGCLCLPAEGIGRGSDLASGRSRREGEEEGSTSKPVAMRTICTKSLREGSGTQPQMKLASGSI